MTHCVPCFRLLYCLGSGWVCLGTLLTLSNVFIVPYQRLGPSILGSWDTCSSTTHLHHRLLIPAYPRGCRSSFCQQAKDSLAMEPGLQCRWQCCPPVCPGRESSGEQLGHWHPWPFKQALHRGLQPQPGCPDQCVIAPRCPLAAHLHLLPLALERVCHDDLWFVQSHLLICARVQYLTIIVRYCW